MFETYIPAEFLRAYVLTYIIIDSENEVLKNNVLPDTSIVLAFRFKGSLSSEESGINNNILPSSSISGLRMSPRGFNYEQNTGNILVLFKETGASAFFKTPMHQLYNDCISLDNFIGRERTFIIEEQLAEAKNNTHRIKLIEDFLWNQLSGKKPDILISTALQKIHDAKGLIKIKELSKSLYMSQDSFEKRFRNIVGVSPKQFTTLVRLKTITSTTNRTSPKLAELAFEAGYFDQPHFNKDFKLFTGQTPTDFFKFPSFLKINDFLQ